MFLAPSADKQTCNCDIECSNHHPSLSTLRPKGLSHSKINYIYVYHCCSISNDPKCSIGKAYMQMVMDEKITVR